MGRRVCTFPKVNFQAFHGSKYMEDIKVGSAPSLEMGCDPKNEKGGPEGTPISEAKLRANRENSKRSTGPKTPRGKANSRFNSLRVFGPVDRLEFSRFARS